jgi:cytidyltransferase-like protein
MVKILKNFSYLKKIKEKYKNKKIGLCHGVFDLLHYGHLQHFDFAKNNCDVLVISLTNDRFVNKGPRQPYNNIEIRSKSIALLKFAEYIFINDEPTSINIIKNLKPNYYFKGQDYLKKDITGNLQKEIKAIKKVNGKIIFSKTPLMSSTKIFNNIFGDFNENDLKEIKLIKKNYNFDFITNNLENLKNHTVTIIGETIIDSYVQCQISGLTSKDPCLSVIKKNTNKIPGGTLAIVKILSLFCKKVYFISYGNNKQLVEFLKNYENVKLINISKQKKIQEKVRYININRNEKLLQTTNFKYEEINNNKNLTKNIIKFSRLSQNLIICDYGIGLFNDKIIEIINNLKIKKFINVQSNSINYGFNLFTKYKNAYYMSLDDKEWKLGFGKKENILLSDIKKLKLFKNISHTLGKDGSIFYNVNKQKFFSRTLIKKTVDTTGSGDAFFAMSTMLLILKLDPKLILFLSNLYAGIHAQYFGNQTITNKVNFLKKIKSIINI